jgi:hypothetical protein
MYLEYEFLRRSVECVRLQTHCYYSIFGIDTGVADVTSVAGNGTHFATHG